MSRFRLPTITDQRAATPRSRRRLFRPGRAGVPPPRYPAPERLHRMM
jgi:hypothetical protein